MVETLEQALSTEKPIIAKPKRYWNMEDIVNADVAHYNRIARADQILNKESSALNAFDRVVEGTAVGLAEIINKTPEQVKILYGQTQMAIALKNGNEERMSVGKALIQTATRNLDMINEEMEKRTITTGRDQESFAYGTGNALASYGSMWLTAGVLGNAARVVGATSKVAQGIGTAGGIANMAVQEMGGEVEEGIQVYREKNPEDLNLDNITPEWASKEVMTTIAYGLISGIIENKMGFGMQRKMFLKPMDIVKRSAVGGISEYTTEDLQSLANMGIDLADGSMDWNKLPKRLQNEFVGNLPALLIGAGGGAVMGVEQRAQTKNAIRELVKDSVPTADLEQVVNNVYDSAIENLSGIVAKELEISSELRAKHGAIYDSMITAVTIAIDKSGSQNFGNESEKAQYISDVSKRFADEVLAEANLRGAPIDEVLEATDIVFEDGGIKFKQHINLLDYVTGIKSMPKDFNLPRTDLLAFLKSQGGIKDIGSDVKSMGAIRQYPGLINNKKGKSLDDLTFYAWEAGYFPYQMERPDINYMLEQIDKALRGTKIYNREGEKSIRDEVTDLIEQLNMLGIDYRNKTTAQLENEIANIEELKSIQRKYDFYLNHEQIVDTGGEILERPEGYEPEEGDLFQLSSEAYDNEGKADTNSEAFKRWFGDSKVVDENGEPLVVYHGTNAEFDTFDKDMSVTNAYGKGFYFSRYGNLGDNSFGKNVMSVYLSIKNPYIAKARSNDIIDTYELKKLGYDGVFIPQRGYYVAFEPTQIKSVDNQGAFDAANPNIYHQGAKGSYNINDRIIRLFSDADYSTLSHEIGHYWLDSIWTYVRSGHASEAYLERWKVLTNWLNIKPDQTRLTRAQQEKFASGYEKYLTKGELPSPLIKGAFDDYDNWLKKVYQDLNNVTYQNGKHRSPIRLTEDAVRFFDSMTTGTLAPPTIKPISKTNTPKQNNAAQNLNSRLKAMKNGKSVQVSDQVADQATIQDDSPAVKENLEPVPNVVPTTQVSNITEGEKGESRVYSREMGKTLKQQLGEELADTLEYNKVNLEDQSMRALKFVRENLEAARKVVNGAKAPEGILDTAIRIAYENEMLRMGNNTEYMRALKLHSAIQTLRGQEIAAERLATSDMLQPKYWINRLFSNKEASVVADLFDGKVSKYRDTIKEETRKAVKDLVGLDLDAQVDYLAGLSENLKETYKIANDNDTLFQAQLEAVLDNNTAPLFVRNFIEEIFGSSVSDTEATTVINKADQLSKSFENSLDANGNPSVESLKILSEMNSTIESLAPSPLLTVMNSILGRSNMLASVKSPTLNIISNIENFITEAVVRRLSKGNYKKSVKLEEIKAYKDWAWNVYKASGFIPSQMMNIGEDITTLGETRPTSQGKGKIRQVTQVMENVVFKYLMGAPDAIAKDWTFTDTLDLEATAIAQAEGLSGDALANRATEIFKDAILIQPQTEEGQRIREKAVEEAHIATYTNNSAVSEFSLKAREWLNMISIRGNKLRAGDILMPFVKTPANVAMLGLEYGLGGLYTAYNIPEIIRNPKSPTAQRAIKAAYRNGLGILLSVLLASLMDPEDYIPEFDNATQKDRDLARAKNAPFNSIKIGGKYVSLDYFGPLAVPLVGILNAQRGENTKDAIMSYIKGTATQAAKIPGVKEVLALDDRLKDIAARSTTPENFMEQISNDVIDQVRARTVPSIVNDLAKILDPYERDTSEGIISKVMASIPGLRNQLPERYNIEGFSQESENPLSILFFGSRIKAATDGAVISEVERLADNKKQPTISDITKRGDLRFLDSSEKVRVRQDYAKEFAKSVRKEMSSGTYRNKDDVSKQQAINKIRKEIVKNLKEKYAKSISLGKEAK